MSFAGYSLVRFLLSDLPTFFFLRTCSRFYFAFGTVYHVTTAGFVADQLIMGDEQQQTEKKRTNGSIIIFVGLYRHLICYHVIQILSADTLLRGREE